MNFLAIDYGERRIGLAHGDSEIGIAMPVPAAVEPDFEGRLAHIAAARESISPVARCFRRERPSRPPVRLADIPASAA